jgi:hypothetical protein
MIWAIAISIVLAGATILFQQQAFRLIFKLTPESSPEDATLGMVGPAVFLAHVVNISVYAVAFGLIQDRLGSIGGKLQAPR